MCFIYIEGLFVVKCIEKSFSYFLIADDLFIINDNFMCCFLYLFLCGYDDFHMKKVDHVYDSIAEYLIEKIKHMKFNS